MNPLSEIIRRETVQHGVLSFARFMELALYCPVHGYYETKKDNPGRHGDFYTSVGVGELFGQLLAFQFAEWLGEMRNAECGVRIVEAGAHDGRLAKDILAWLLSNRPELFDRLDYWLIEPSARRQEWQGETLREFAPRVRWFDSLQSISSPNPKSSRPAGRNPELSGIIFSNELLDAMPVHRFGWDAAKKTWFEWGVAVDGEKFVWAKIPSPQSAIRNPQLEAVLPDGYTIEICPAAESWWREAAGILKHGKLMTIDYGLTADELFSPSCPRGTLRAYFRHHASDDLLANVGEQDLTAHVNFSALQAAGKSAGLRTEMFSTQSQFLTRILEKASKANSLGKWTPAQARQFQTLTHPEHLGRAFRVLVQSR
ncbi:MAG: SAM-dependent methyltransferase [Verrucomicrobiota bacterium]|jgi:SAM-dependent MidA family methyltransferase